MKCIINYLAVSVLLWSACTGYPINESLNQVDNLVHEAPDSALQLLRTVDRSALNTARLKAEYALLLSLAQDKCYIDVTEDSTAMVALKYYTKTRDSYHQMLAWYSLARVQCNAGKPSNAIISFLEAEKFAQDLENWHYLGLIYQNIADLYSNQNDIPTAKSYYEKSVICFNKLDEYNYSAYSEYSIALAHNYLKEHHKCDSLLNKVEQFALSSSDVNLFSNVLLSKGHILLRRPNEDPKRALSLLQQGKKYSGGYLSSQHAAGLMMAFAITGQPDSANVYQALAWASAKTPRDSANLYSSSYWIAQKTHNYKEANDFLTKAMSIQNRLIYHRESMAIANAIADYNQQRLEATQERERNQKQLFSIATLCALLFLLWLIQRLKLRNMQNREKDRIIAEKEEQIQEDLAKTEEILQEVNNLKHTNSEMMQGLAESILEQMGMVKKWSDAYYGINKPEKDPYYYLDQDSLQKKKDIIRSFCESLAQMRNDEQWFQRLESQINLHNHGIMKRLREVCRQEKQMSDSDFRTLLLMFAGLPDKSIAYFQDLSYGAVRMRRLRYRHFFRELNHPDAPSFLNALGG